MVGMVPCKRILFGRKKGDQDQNPEICQNRHALFHLGLVGCGGLDRLLITGMYGRHLGLGARLLICRLLGGRLLVCGLLRHGLLICRLLGDRLLVHCRLRNRLLVCGLLRNGLLIHRLLGGRWLVCCLLRNRLFNNRLLRGDGRSGFIFRYRCENRSGLYRFGGRDVGLNRGHFRLHRCRCRFFQDRHRGAAVGTKLAYAMQLCAAILTKRHRYSSFWGCDICRKSKDPYRKRFLCHSKAGAFERTSMGVQIRSSSSKILPHWGQNFGGAAGSAGVQPH